MSYITWYAGVYWLYSKFKKIKKNRRVKKKKKSSYLLQKKAPGLSLLPISLIKGRKGIDAENEDVENRLAATKEKLRVLRSRYIGKNMSSKDQRILEELEDEER